MLINVLPWWFVSENDLCSSISRVVVFVSRGMLFVSFLRHSPSHFPEGNLVFSMIGTIVFMCFFARGFDPKAGFPLVLSLILGHRVLCL